MRANPSTPPPGRPVPVSIHVALVPGLLGGILLALFVVPLLPARGALLLVPVALLTATYWSAVHEGIHGNLHPRRSANQRLGRALGVLYGAPFRALRFGHLLHHRYPWLDWHDLPRAFRHSGFGFEGGYLRTALRQLNGPIRSP